jgi:hypothetical protein
MRRVFDTRSGVRETIVNALSAIVGIGAALGGAIYAAIWFSYVGFYDQFGLHPKDVGLNQGDIIRTAAVGFVLFVALATLTVAIWWIMSGWLARFLDRLLGTAAPARGGAEFASKRRRLRKAVTDRRTIAVVGGVLLLPVVSLYFNDFALTEPFLPLTLGTVSAVVLAALTSAFAGKEPWQWTGSTIAVWLAALSAVFIGVVLILDIRAVQLADDVLEDGRLDSRFFLFDFRLDPVFVEGTSERRIYLFMGESGNGPVLYDPRSRTVVRNADNPEVIFVPPDSVSFNCTNQ